MFERLPLLGVAVTGDPAGRLGFEGEVLGYRAQVGPLGVGRFIRFRVRRAVLSSSQTGSDIRGSVLDGLEGGFRQPCQHTLEHRS